MKTQLRAVIQKELRQTFRDPRMLAMLLMAPMLQTTLLGFAVDLDVDRVATAFEDRDRTPESRALVRGLVAEQTFAEVGETWTPDQTITAGDAQVVVVIPPRTARHLLERRASPVQILVDGTDPTPAQVGVSAAGQYFALRGADQARAVLASSQGTVAPVGTVDVVPRIFYNPQLKTRLYMVPGVAAVVLLIVTTVVTAMGIARERELGTIEQILVTPIRPSTLLVGKTLPFGMIGLVAAGLVISVGTNVFGVPIRGSLPVLLLGTILYLMSTLGTGILISTIARTQQQAILGGFFFILPAMLLSGFMSPIRNMPHWIQLLTLANPVRHYVEILRAVLLKGAGLVDLLRPLSILLAFGIGILSVASLRFQKRIG